MTGGLGHHGYVIYCVTHNLRIVTLRVFHNCFGILQTKMIAYHIKQIDRGVEAIVNYYLTQNSQITDIVVSFDAFWMTRGHKSPIEVGFFIRSETRFVIDL